MDTNKVLSAFTALIRGLPSGWYAYVTQPIRISSVPFPSGTVTKTNTSNIGDDIDVSGRYKWFMEYGVKKSGVGDLSLGIGQYFALPNDLEDTITSECFNYFLRSWNDPYLGANIRSQLGQSGIGALEATAAGQLASWTQSATEASAPAQAAGTFGNVSTIITQAELSFASNRDAAISQIETMLKTTYDLPSGWMYVVSVDTIETTISLSAIALNLLYAFETVPAGKVSVDLSTYGDYTSAFKALLLAFPSQRPVYMNAAKNAQVIDFQHKQKDMDTGSFLPVLSSPFDSLSVSINSPNQGFSSEGQAPWDSQTDVVNPDGQIPNVIGTIVGAGYKATTGKYPSGFTDWLNLKIPNAAEVLQILNDPIETQDYLFQFQLSLSQPFVSYGQPGGSGNDFIGLPNAYGFEKASPIVVAGDVVTDGAGFTQAQDNLGGGTAQSLPKNLETINGDYLDSVQAMADGAATDFLNMLATMYSTTVAKIRAIPAARKELNDLIDAGRIEQIEPFLRDFDASTYATAPVAKTTTPAAAQASTFAGIDGKTALIVLGILLGIYFVSRKAAA